MLTNLVNWGLLYKFCTYSFSAKNLTHYTEHVYIIYFLYYYPPLKATIHFSQNCYFCSSPVLDDRLANLLATSMNVDGVVRLPRGDGASGYESARIILIPPLWDV